MNVKAVLYRLVMVVILIGKVGAVLAEEPIGTIEWEGNKHSFYDRNNVVELEWGVVGAWRGTGLVDDKRTTFFIGHNPGEFSWMFSAEKGQIITVEDRNGNSKDYEITKKFKMDDYWYGLEDLQGQDLLGYFEHFDWVRKEGILLQTCQGYHINLILVAMEVK